MDNNFDLVTSRQNRTFKYIQKLLKDKSFRIAEKKFWIDGVNFTNQALDNGWEIEKLIYVPEKLTTEFRKEVVIRVPEQSKLAVSSELYRVLANKDDIQGVGAIVKAKVSENTLFPGVGVVLENISNPGNLGMIMRTCTAFGASNLYIINPAVDPFNPESIRSSMEGIFFLNISVFNSIESFEKHKDIGKFQSFGTSLQADSIDIESLDKRFLNSEDVLIWFGNESKGMTEKAKKLCEKLLHIKMTNKIDSLNIAGSASIVLNRLMQIS